MTTIGSFPQTEDGVLLSLVRACHAGAAV